MAAPNIVGVTTITGKTDVLAITNSATAITSNGAGSGTVVKVNSLYIANIHATTAGWITVDLYRSSVAYRLANQIPVPINSTINIIEKGLSIYLEEGDTLRLTANASSYLEGVCSYEVIS